LLMSGRRIAPSWSFADPAVQPQFCFSLAVSPRRRKVETATVLRVVSQTEGRTIVIMPAAWSLIVLRAPRDIGCGDLFSSGSLGFELFADGGMFERPIVFRHSAGHLNSFPKSGDLGRVPVRERPDKGRRGKASFRRKIVSAEKKCRRVRGFFTAAHSHLARQRRRNLETRRLRRVTLSLVS